MANVRIVLALLAGVVVLTAIVFAYGYLMIRNAHRGMKRSWRELLTAMRMRRFSEERRSHTRRSTPPHSDSGLADESDQKGP